MDQPAVLEVDSDDCITVTDRGFNADVTPDQPKSM